MTGNSYSNLNIVNDRGVGVWSAGGHAENGHNGGWGGHVSLTQTGDLSGQRSSGAALPAWVIHDSKGNARSTADSNQRFTSVDVLPMIFVLSQGGAGGDDSNNRGPGGSGQTATLNLQANVATTGDRYAGAWVSSVGLLSGWGGSNSSRASYLTSQRPSGGAASATLAQGFGVSTNGANAVGLVVESVGASGGGNWKGDNDKWPSMGGDGGAVSAINSGTINTAGADSIGLVAQSLGGEGSQQQYDGSSAHNGGAGGNAGSVTASNYGSIVTTGDSSYGVALYSVGGLGASGSVKSTFGSGSYAGDNGRGGAVSFTNGANASILTLGDEAYGVLAQSVGGGIVAGYYNPLAGQTAASGGDSGAWGHGGDGSVGGGAGMVTVTNSGSIETRGSDAAALVAQSLGGLGGNGGDTVHGDIFVAVGLGGNGGEGGAGGTVDVSASGAITTRGDSSAAIVAQSIGGGGGHGGVAQSYSAGAFISVSIAIGGSGGAGGDTGPVYVNNAATLLTEGHNSAGIYAQSIGGGGGHGGSASAVAAAFGGGDVPSAAASVSIGGAGGSGASGNTVQVQNVAPITTYGVSSHGILGQSIGGGASGYVLSASQYAVGSSVSVGASGGGAGHAGAVNLSHSSGAISTYGAGAHGVYGQAIGGGGGGGSGGNASAAADIFKLNGIGIAMNLALGGNGGGGGDGAAVNLRLDGGGSITTRGTFANGMFAQSVGGGGGSGGNADSSAGTGLLFGDTVSTLLADSKVGGIIAVQSTVGGKGGAGGKGAAVEIDMADASSIQTWSAHSHGVFAQSIGGGGGNGGSMTSDKGGDADDAATFVSQARRALGVDKFEAWVQYNGYDDDYKTLAGLKRLIDDTDILNAFETEFRKELLTRLYGLAENHNWAASMFQKAGLIDEDGNVVESEAEEEQRSMSLTVGVGGTGGKGGGGGDVTVVTNAALTTFGIGSHGVFAQSIGGGGGAGGLASSSNKDGNTINLNVMVGGNGGAANPNDPSALAGGAVVIANTGAINTGGGAAYGLFGQSVGGGGGVGGGAISPETRHWKFIMATATGAGTGSADALFQIALAHGRKAIEGAVNAAFT